MPRRPGLPQRLGAAPVLRVLAQLMSAEPVSVPITQGLARELAWHQLAAGASASSPSGDAAGLRLLHRAARHETIQGMRVAATTAQLAGTLGEADIPALFWKGAALSAAVAQPVGRRASSDVDVVVRRCDLEQVTLLLASFGYTSRRSRSPLVRRGERWLLLERTFVGPGPAIDVHWRIDGRANYRHEFEALWQQRATVTVAGVTVPTLGPADALLATVVHGNRELWFRLRQLLDFARQAHVLAPGTAAELPSLARRTGCARALAVAVAMTDTVLGPGALLSSVPVMERDRALAADRLETITRGPTRPYAPGQRVRNRTWKWHTADGGRVEGLALAVARLGSRAR